MTSDIWIRCKSSAWPVDPTCTEHSSPLSKRYWVLLEFCDIRLPLFCEAWWDKTYALIIAEANGDQQPGVGRGGGSHLSEHGQIQLLASEYLPLSFRCWRKLIFNQFCMLHKMLNLETAVLPNFLLPYSDYSQSLSQVWLFASVHGILQARILEWLPFPPLEDLPHPGIEPLSLASLAAAGGFFVTNATWEVPSLPKHMTRNGVYQRVCIYVWVDHLKRINRFFFFLKAEQN